MNYIETIPKRYGLINSMVLQLNDTVYLPATPAITLSIEGVGALGVY